jgi:hypothetical protein
MLMHVRIFASIAVCVAVAAAGCGTPVPELNFELNQSNDQSCPSSDCRAVPLPCPTVIHIQIFDPNDVGHPFLDQCTPVNRDVTDDICTLTSVDLLTTPIPVRHLEVQVSLYAAASLPRNPDNSYVCPNVPFAASGFPVEAASLEPGVPSPAIGGVGWYDPGDSKVTVTLGCTNLAAMQACMSKNLITVNATVLDFQSNTLVLQGGGVKSLDLSIGEPHGVDGRATFNVDDVKQITIEPNIPDGVAATWGGPVDVPIDQFACVNVLQTAAQSTASVTCVAKSAQVNTVDIRGVWLQRAQLTAILAALAPMPFPDDGITIGMVLDKNGQPAHGRGVSAMGANVRYLTESSDGKSYTVSDKPTADSTIFVSTDAPFPTEFTSMQDTDAPTLLELGGKIAGRVTMVILGTPSASVAARAASTLP